MGQRLVREMIARDMAVKGARVLILGVTFKEDVPDLRNTRVLDIKTELEGFGITVDVHDPLVAPEDAKKHLQLDTVQPEPGRYDAVVLAVAHKQIKAGGLAAILPLMSGPPLILDIKGALPRDPSVLRV